MNRKKVFYMTNKELIRTMRKGFDVQTPDIWDKIQNTSLAEPQQNIKYRKAYRQMLAVASTFSIILVIAVCYWVVNFHNGQPGGSQSNNITFPEQSAQINNNGGNINVMQLRNMPERSINMYDLLSKDFIPMTTQQLVDYYGTNFIPKNIPNGIF